MWLCSAGRGWCLHRRCPARPDSYEVERCDDAGHLEYGDLNFGDFHDVPGGLAGGVACRGPLYAGVESRGRKFPSRSFTISARTASHYNAADREPSDHVVR